MSRKALVDFLKSPLSEFESWVTPEGYSPQGEFLRGAQTHQTRMFRSGNRTGKTAIGGVDVALHLTGFHPWTKFKGPQHWWASGLDWEFGVGGVLWPAIKPLIPKSMIRSIAWHRKTPPEIPKSIILTNGSQLDFKSADSGPKKYQGAELHGLWVDEEHPWDVVEEGRTRLLKKQGYLNVTLTPVQRMRWTQDLEREEGTLLIRASMIDAARAGLLDLAAVERFAAALPERQRRVRVNGELIALEGRVYPDLERTTHEATVLGPDLFCNGTRICPWPIPPSWRRWAALDFGFANPTAVPIAAEDPHTKRLIVYRCYYARGIRYSEWARLLKARLPRLHVPLICDHDANGREELRTEGISTMAAKKDIEPGLEAVERMLKKKVKGAPALVFVVNEHDNDAVLGRCDADKVLWEGENYHYPKTKEGRPDPTERPVKKDDHALDALRYLCMLYEGSRALAPRPPDPVKVRRQRDLFMSGYALNDPREDW